MFFPAENSNNLVILIGNDACGIVSSTSDLNHLTTLWHERIANIYTISLQPMSLVDKHIHYTCSSVQTFQQECISYLNRILENEPASSHIFLLISGDASQVLFLSEPLTQLLKVPLSGVVLVDACASGNFLNFPRTTSTPNNARLCCVNACESNEYDQDDISIMGFDGGLSSDVIDYLMTHNRFDVNEFFIFREAQNQKKEPIIHSILSFHE